MARFRKDNKKGLPPISTASLPDVVFMLLIFFMVTTQLREVDLMVKIKTPQATQLKKLEKKSLVSFIYIGQPKPSFQKLYGTEPRIQLNDQFAGIDDIRDFVSSERESMSENDRGYMTVSMKVDEMTRMGIVTDIKQALRKANALKINYSARKLVKRTL